VSNNTGSDAQPISARCALWCSACRCRRRR